MTKIRALKDSPLAKQGISIKELMSKGFKEYLNTGYWVDKLGNIYNPHIKKIINPKYTIKGYKVFSLKNRHVPVHRAIAICFIPNPNNHPIVCHLDDVKTNNSLENLAWGNKSMNMHQAIKNGKLINRGSPHGERNRNSKLTEKQVYKLRILYSNGTKIKDLAKKFNVCSDHLLRIATGKAWKKYPMPNEHPHLLGENK